jgi:hypothetical protein
MHRTHILLALFCVALIAAGCSGSIFSSANSGTRYEYQYTMVDPALSDQLKFQDSNISISFTIDASAIVFELHNNSDQQLSIVWERASFGVNKRSYSIRNSTTLYTLGSATPQPITIPPQGFVRELVMPWQNVNYENGSWTEKDLFLMNDSGTQKIKGVIESMVGSEITLMLPVRIGKLVMDYSFTFKVSAAKPLPPGTLPKEKERPPVPDSPLMGSTIMQGYLPIIISAGILVVAMVIFTQKKAPIEGL